MLYVLVVEGLYKKPQSSLHVVIATIIDLRVCVVLKIIRIILKCQIVICHKMQTEILKLYKQTICSVSTTF